MSHVPQSQDFHQLWYHGEQSPISSKDALVSLWRSVICVPEFVCLPQCSSEELRRYSSGGMKWLDPSSEEVWVRSLVRIQIQVNLVQVTLSILNVTSILTILGKSFPTSHVLLVQEGSSPTWSRYGKCSLPFCFIFWFYLLVFGKSPGYWYSLNTLIQNTVEKYTDSIAVPYRASFTQCVLIIANEMVVTRQRKLH